MMGMRRGAVTVLVGVIASGGCERVFDVASREFADAPGTSPGAGIHLIQTTSHAWQHNETPTPIAFDNDVQQGDLVVAMVANFASTTTAVTDGIDDYQPSAMETTTAGGTVMLYYAVAKETGHLIVTVAAVSTDMSNEETSLILHDYRGAAAKPFDSATQTFGTGLNTPNEITVGPLIAAADNELMVVALAHDAFVTEVAEQPFQIEVIAVDNNQMNMPLASADAIVPAGATEATLTMTDRSGWAAVMVAFKPQ